MDSGAWLAVWNRTRPFGRRARYSGRGRFPESSGASCSSGHGWPDDPRQTEVRDPAGQPWP
ncbi:hypothetical protein QM306_37960, partial [Burkholderia cenocepacia]|nr:hypothetical protein [Burkholderia cenocepacia]